MPTVVVDEGLSIELTDRLGWDNVQDAADFANLWFGFKRFYRERYIGRVTFDTLLGDHKLRREFFSHVPSRLKDKCMGSHPEDAGYELLARGLKLRKRFGELQRNAGVEQKKTGGFDLGDL